MRVDVDVHGLLDETIRAIDELPSRHDAGVVDQDGHVTHVSPHLVCGRVDCIIIATVHYVAIGLSAFCPVD